MGWWLMCEATSVVHGGTWVMLLLLLQGLVIEKVVIKEIATRLVGVKS